MTAALWAIVPAFSVTGAGVAGLVRAGRLEAAGRLADARAAARGSGFVTALGSAGTAALAIHLDVSAGARFAAMSLVLGCGGTSLLAGLSGKPRPSATAAVVMLLAAAIVLSAAV